MNDLPETSRNLTELIAKYTLNDSIRDIYVEGITDKAIIDWFLERIGRRDIVVYEIRNVAIPDDIIVKHNYNKECNRSKILALAKELAFLSKKKNLLCIIDKDFADITNEKLNRIPHILKTDYTCIEMYLLCEELLDKFITLVLHGLIFSSAQIISFVNNVLRRAFLIRLANHMLKWNMRWLDIWKDVKIGRTQCTFDEDRFINRYLMKNSAIKKKETFISKINKLETKLSNDPRQAVHGHDFIDLLCEIVKKYKKSRAGICDRETMVCSMCGCLELNMVQTKPMFQAISAF